MQTNQRDQQSGMNREEGFFGEFGGRFVPEMLIPALDELAGAYQSEVREGDFWGELTQIQYHYNNRPTPLYYAANLTKHLGGAKIYLKSEHLNHTGAHKINNALGQVLLARRMGKRIVVAETGAGQHGLATATAAAKMGLKCRVFMGRVDMERQYPNVYAMKLMGARVQAVEHGQKTLKDAVNAAMKYWISHLEDTFYVLGSALGPHPYPMMVREFQSVIGKEVRKQIMERENRLPHALIACVGGGSNALGLFSPFMKMPKIRLTGVEAGGKGDRSGQHAARLSGQGSPGVVQGFRSIFLQDEWGQLRPTHSISAGLDYAGVGPELAAAHKKGRIRFARVRDEEVLRAFRLLCETEGIIPALESAHALAYLVRTAKEYPAGEVVVVNLSGRGDKDLFITAGALDPLSWSRYLKKVIREIPHG